MYARHLVGGEVSYWTGKNVAICSEKCANLLHFSKFKSEVSLKYLGRKNHLRGTNIYSGQYWTFIFPVTVS